jgi:hypothetical protein
MNKKLEYWLKEGKQSKITPLIKKIVKEFDGKNEYEKIYQILNWIEKNTFHKYNHKKFENDFANRTAEKIIKDKFTLGCHDNALLTATFLRAINIPAKFIEGIDKLDPHNKGHCVVEAHIKRKWILIDPCRYILSLKPSRNQFYKENYIIGKGLDPEDIGIKKFDSWKKKSKSIIKYIENISNYS